MSITPNNETKNSLSVTNEVKVGGATWDDATYTWDDADGTWELPGLHITKEAKNSLSVTNEAKN